MPLCLIVTRDVEARYQRFLGSAMLEIAPGVYAAPRLSAAVRDRIWTVISDWHEQLNRGSIVMTWAEPASTGQLGLHSLGNPPKDIVVHENNLLIRREIAQDQDMG